MVRSARPEPADADTADDAEECGRGFRDNRGVINCNGCGIKCKSGAEFVMHAKQVQLRGEQGKVETKKVDYLLSVGSGVRDSTKGLDRCLGGEGDSQGKQIRNGGKTGDVEHLAEKERMTGASAKPVINTEQRPINTEYPVPTENHQTEKNTSDFPSLAKTVQQPSRVSSAPPQNTNSRNSASPHSSMMSSVSTHPSMVNNASR